MQDWRHIVGANIGRLRRDQGLTQEKLAFKAGIDLTYMGGIERGRRNPTLLILVRIAEGLGASLPDLLKPPRVARPRAD